MSIINLDTWLIKNNNQCRGFKVVEPTKKNNITLRFVHQDLNCTYSLNDNTLIEAVDMIFEQLTNLGCTFSKKSICTAVKNKLYKILTKDYERLTKELGVKYIKYNSLSGLFYKKSKLIGIDIRQPKNDNYSVTIDFKKAGVKTCCRSIEVHGFKEAFDQVFEFACKQMGIQTGCTSVLLFKSIIKQDIIRKYSTLK